MSLPVNPRKLISICLGVLYALHGSVVVPVEAQKIGIAAISRNDISIEIPVVQGAWTKLEKSPDLLSWSSHTDPLFDLTEFSIDPTESSVGFFRFTQYPEPSPPYTVAVVGDSTAAGVIHGAEIVSGGWAEGMRVHAGPDTRILNAGEPGLSSKSFLGDRRQLLNILIRTTPEFVFIQFGQIDEFSKSEELRSTTIEEYQENLSTIVELVREWNGIPILVTPLPWRRFNPDGSISSVLRNRSDAILEVAQKTGALAIDFHAILSSYYPTITSDELKSISAVDQYHFSEKGAEVGAGLLINALPQHIRALLFDSELF
jgi:lysophospholipase L1-like esterase